MRGLARKLALLQFVWLLVACSSAPDTDQASAADPVILSFTRSGGLQGKTETIIVNRDNTLVVLEGNRDGRETKRVSIPAAQVESLQSFVASTEWQQLADQYGRQAPDGYAYTIEANGKRVVTFDGATKPPALENVLAQLNALWQTAQNLP